MHPFGVLTAFFMDPTLGSGITVRFDDGAADPVPAVLVGGALADFFPFYFFNTRLGDAKDAARALEYLKSSAPNEAK